MNDLELICAPAENRMELLRQWYESAYKILTGCEEVELCCGGHAVFAPEMKLHIFIGNFAKYRNSCITVDEALERI